MNSLIHLKKCSSTNDEIIDFINNHHLSENFLAIYTFNQTKGKGQYGNSWEGNPEENLAYSFVMHKRNISFPDNIFNYYTAIIVKEFIANLTKTDVKIKWPNDIIIKNKKICGMLFEKKKDYLIAGIGVNILQKEFENLPKAGSILMQTHLEFELKKFVEAFHYYILEKFNQENISENILEIYNASLYKRDEIAVFEKDRLRQNGIIKYADEDGNLWIELEKEGLQKFFHKEIELLY